MYLRLGSHYTDSLTHLHSCLPEKTRPRSPWLNIYTAIPGKTDLIGAFSGTKESIDCYIFSIRLILTFHRNPILASVSDVHLLTAVSIFWGGKRNRPSSVIGRRMCTFVCIDRPQLGSTYCRVCCAP